MSNIYIFITHPLLFQVPSGYLCPSLRTCDMYGISGFSESVLHWGQLKGDIYRGEWEVSNIYMFITHPLLFQVPSGYLCPSLRACFLPVILCISYIYDFL